MGHLLPVSYCAPKVYVSDFTSTKTVMIIANVHFGVASPSSSGKCYLLYGDFTALLQAICFQS
jgi:hypothetical protein